MNKQLIVRFATEGKTDVRFLESVIQRSFEDIAFECRDQIEVLPLQHIRKISGDFISTVKIYSQKAEELGIMILCIHTDADSSEDTNAFEDKINPAFSEIKQSTTDFCKNLIAVVPVRMTEAWMLADKNLLKNEIGTQKTDQELNINKNPESFSDPKKTLEDAIRIAQQDLTKRKRRNLTIGELYLPIGQKISIAQLDSLPSFWKFKEAIKAVFKDIKYV